MKNTRIAILMGSDKDMNKMQPCTDAADPRNLAASIVSLTDPSIDDRLAEYRESWSA